MRPLPALVLLALTVAPAAAQPAPDPATPRSLAEVEAGSRILLVEGRGMGQRNRVGRLVSADSAFVVLLGDRGDTTRVARGAIRQAFLGRGARSRGPSAATGALAGALIGGIVGYAAGSDCDPGAFVCFDRSETTPMGAMGGMAVGGLIGLAVGGGEKWQEIALPASVSLVVRPAGRGTALVELRF